MIGGKTTDRIGVPTLDGENADSTDAQGISNTLRTETSVATLTAEDSTQEPPPRIESISNLLDDSASFQIKVANPKMNEKKRAGWPKKFHVKLLNKKVSLKSSKSRTHSKITDLNI